MIFKYKLGTQAGIKAGQCETALGPEEQYTGTHCARPFWLDTRGSGGGAPRDYFAQQTIVFLQN